MRSDSLDPSLRRDGRAHWLVTLEGGDVAQTLFKGRVRKEAAPFRFHPAGCVFARVHVTLRLSFNVFHKNAVL